MAIPLGASSHQCSGAFPPAPIAPGTQPSARGLRTKLVRAPRPRARLFRLVSFNLATEAHRRGPLGEFPAQGRHVARRREIAANKCLRPPVRMQRHDPIFGVFKIAPTAAIEIAFRRQAFRKQDIVAFEFDMPIGGPIDPLSRDRAAVDQFSDRNQLAVDENRMFRAQPQIAARLVFPEGVGANSHRPDRLRMGMTGSIEPAMADPDDRTPFAGGSDDEIGHLAEQRTASRRRPPLMGARTTGDDRRDTQISALKAPPAPARRPRGGASAP